MSARLPSASELEELAHLHRCARYLDAFTYAVQFRPPEEWPDAHALVLAGRLFSCWGNEWLSSRCHQRAWRLAPEDPAAAYFASLSVERKHGPLEALRFLRDLRHLYETDTPTRDQVWLWLQVSRLLAAFRDYDSAEPLLRRAEPHVADDPWYWVELSRIRERQDRYEDALGAAERALQLGPNYRPSVETMGHLLMLRSRDDEALFLLQRSVETMQAGNLAMMLATLLAELDRHEDALAALELAARWQPRASSAMAAWLAGRRADELRSLGRYAEAATEARRAKTVFQSHIADRISSNEMAGTHRRLSVPFVRQHHMTCVPATLTAIGAYWNRAVDHLELARTICYDGTPDHEERHWAETHGWIAREFRVTWDAAVALLDRGCPFTLTTVATRSAHLQAVVGYDSRFKLLLIRDPYQRSHGECLAEPFLAAAASHGPRGMLLVPPDRAHLLDGIDLPDAALYDAWYALRRALQGHDRGAAQAAVDCLKESAPNHRLAWQAHRELASYDGDHLRQLEATRALLALHPGDPNFRLDEAQLLHWLGDAREHRTRVEALGEVRNTDPQFVREYCEMLAEDARNQPRAFRLARRLLRLHPIDAGNLRTFANLLWHERDFLNATAVYRLAACVGDKLEHHWDSYFAASRHVQQTEQCLQLLQEREVRLGTQSGYPARTLFRALDTLDRSGEAFALLEAALARRPEDGELLIFAAECHSRYGRLETARRLLDAAVSRVPRGLWLRADARWAELRGDHAHALADWRELLATNPNDLTALKGAANAVAAVESRTAALALLREAVARLPNSIPRIQTLLEWLRSEPPDEALTLLDHLITLQPTNAWALREKALVLRRSGRASDALALARTARQIDPISPYSAGVEGLVLQSLGRLADARRAYESALALSIDCGYIDDLLATCPTFEERKAAAAFLQAEIARQPVQDGGAFLRFREIARSLLAPAVLQAVLETLLEARRENWGAWSALALHQVEQGQIDAGLTRAREAVERFPLTPRLWVDLATAQSRSGDAAGEISSLRRALELSPTWSHPAHALAVAYERGLQLDEAEHTLRRAVAADPLDASSHARLADLLWRRGQQAEALAAIGRAIELAPAYHFAWERLDAWCKSTGDPERPVRLARELTLRRPGDAHAWVHLGRMQFRDPDAALATLAHAESLDPRLEELHDLRARALADLKRYDEAIAACRPAVFGGHIPHDLLGRAAWLEYTRGRTGDGIAQMRAVLNEHPDYAWGWHCLTEWLWETGNVAEALEAATKWAWLAPWNPIPLGYAASAQQRAGKRKEAKDLYWRALHVDPAYLYGAQALLQLLAEDRDIEQATLVFRHIETHFSKADAHRAAVLYHVMRRDKAAAGAALADLARQPGNHEHLLSECTQALAEAGWRGTIEQSLASLFGEPSVPAQIARLWVEAWAPDRSWRKLRRLARLGASEALQREAWAAAIEQMGDARARWRIRWLVWRRREWLRASADTWGAVGYALVTLRRYRRAAKWLADWPNRPDAKPWMLHNLAFAQYCRRKPEFAEPVVDAALNLPADQTRPRLLAWQALERALAGDIVAARTPLANVDAAKFPAYTKLIHGLAGLVADFHAQAPEDRRGALRTAKARLKSLWAETPGAGSDGSLVHQRARTLRHLGRHARSWWTVLQSYLPPADRRYAHAGETVRDNWWLWIIGIVGLGNLIDACSR